MCLRDTVCAPHFVSVHLGPTNIGWSGAEFVLRSFRLSPRRDTSRCTSIHQTTLELFYIRRICRIFPLYFAFLLVAVMACKVLHSPARVPWWYCPFSCRTSGWLFTIILVVPFLTPTLTLAVEEQFYFTLLALDLPRDVTSAIQTIDRWNHFGSDRSDYALLYGATLFHRSHCSSSSCQMDSLLAGVLTATFCASPARGDSLQSHRRQLWTAGGSAHVLVPAIFPSYSRGQI